MPAKKNRLTPEQQRKLFEEEVRKRKEAGDFDPEVAEAGVNPLLHYMDHGGFEGRDPHPLFDTSFYCDNNPEVLQERTNPLFHFLSRGGFEAGDPHPLFSVSFYFHSNPDIRHAGVNPLVHFVVHGAREERDVGAAPTDRRERRELVERALKRCRGRRRTLLGRRLAA